MTICLRHIEIEQLVEDRQTITTKPYKMFVF